MTTETIEADYVVVGAGSAGCVLASRLSETPGVSVLLVEAGTRERIGLTRMPAALMRTIGNPRYDWGYRSEPDPTRNGLVEDWPRGKVPGGSSAINGMIFIRGAAADYDAWESLGCAGWGWRDVLPLFRRMETADAPDNATRGGMGPQRVSALAWRHPVASDFIASGVAAGIPANDDLNGASHEGIAWNQGSTRNGLRHSAWDAFIRPNLARPNLRTMDGVLVQRITFEGRRASGLAATRNGAALAVRARREVILTAGAINSPQLLMLSGVGETSELAAHGIATVADSPEVGRNLMEHPGLYVQAELTVPTVNAEAAPLRAAWQFLRWAAGRPSPFGVPTAQVLAFLRSHPEAAEPDLQFHLFPYGSVLKDGKRIIPRRNLATILVNVNHPRSRGRLALRSADPAAPIAIHPRLLDDDQDVETLLRGLGWVRRMATTAPFGDKVKALIGVPPAAAGREADIAFLRSAARPFYHPAGTCRMGADARAVVAPDLRVNGVSALRVADISIFPRHIAGNTNATALMIGEKAAELVTQAS
ncbi:choline dehydrogenase [Roseomonas sp. JC162]|uniref:Choline dehydrogenase n=1 Tax=Neoroseomonas marina TaxID=1232220 RepID=A0A848E8R3_9PROT|nr:GMC family oxidoreductase N-terminal domain-containing protein [Neoroseomonas marina]NMJ39863.1 choline dehydrogenase [Neoroseomonas marina]